MADNDTNKKDGTTIAVDSAYRFAEALVESLVDDGPGTLADICERLGWSKSRFRTAVNRARQDLCPYFGVAIPHPTPETGWRYQVTTEWQPVEEGASYSLGQVEARLRGIHRDVKLILPHLEKGSTAWRRANFLEKHTGHIISTLGEINDSR